MSDNMSIPSGSLDEKISQRLNDLKAEGNRQISLLGTDSQGYYNTFVRDALVPSCSSWISSVTNMVQRLTPPSNPLEVKCKKMMQAQPTGTGIYSSIVLNMSGLLNSLEEEWKWGFLGHMEYAYFAESFDQFLDQAQRYHKGGKHIESSVLASAVLEDTIKKICKKNNIQSQDISLDPLIDELVKQNVITSVQAKRIKSYTAVRNLVNHAEWESVNLKDVGHMIDGIRDLIVKHL